MARLWSPHRVGLALAAEATAALAASVGPLGLAYGFALIFRSRAGWPPHTMADMTPADLGLPYEDTQIESPGGLLPAWYVPAPGGPSRPCVVLVHGWGSNRAGMLNEAAYLHRCGFQCLLFVVRGHGPNPSEPTPLTSVEFGEDAAAAVRAVAARPTVRGIGILGRSMGAGGAILAAAEEPRVRAVVSVSCPAGPVILARDIFRVAGLPIPGLLAPALAQLTARVFIRPRHHPLDRTDPRRGLEHYLGPVLLVHGTVDPVIAPREMALLAASARAARAIPRRSGQPARRHQPLPWVEASRRGPVQTYLVPRGGHDDLTKNEDYRVQVATFLCRWLGGPHPTAEVAEMARAGGRHRRPATRQIVPHGGMRGLRWSAAQH